MSQWSLIAEEFHFLIPNNPFNTGNPDYLIEDSGFAYARDSISFEYIRSSQRLNIENVAPKTYTMTTGNQGYNIIPSRDPKLTTFSLVELTPTI